MPAPEEEAETPAAEPTPGEEAEPAAEPAAPEAPEPVTPEAAPPAQPEEVPAEDKSLEDTLRKLPLDDLLQDIRDL